MSHSLLFDDTLELCDESGAASDAGYWFETLAEGLSWGDPQPIEVAINSLLRDGAITETESNGNREQSFQVRVKSTDSAGLAEGVAALHRAIGKRTTLVWTPPDGFGAATVFMVETSSLQSPGSFDDLAFMRNEMVLVLRLVCLPFARSVDKIIDNAGTPPSAGGTLLYNCESTTGWAPTGYAPSGSLYVVDSVVFSEGAGSIKSRTQDYDNWTPGESHSRGQDKVSGLSLSTGTGGYLSVRVRFQWTQVALNIFVTTATGGRVQVTSPLATQIDAAGFVHYVWPVAAGLTITAVDFQWNQSGPVISSLGTNPHYVWYDAFELLPAATTDHQIVKQLDVKGSARTPGSLHIAAPTDSVSLAQVLAITVSTDELLPGFLPDTERWITQGTTTADSSALGGHYYTPSTSAYDPGTGKPIFDVPVEMLAAGPYMVAALVKAETSSLNFGVQAQLRVAGTNTGPLSTAETSPTGLTTGWQFVTVGTVYLPPLPVQSADSTTKVRLLFKGAKFANVYLVPAWRVGGRPVADFSIVDCGSGVVAAGGPSSNLWIDSPSTEQPQGGWWRGPAANRTNTQSAWPDAKKPGAHVFSPGSLTAFVVSTGAQGPTVALEYYPAWFGAAAL